MAVTTLAISSNRLYSEVLLSGSVATVAADAAINEAFILPVGFGEFWLHYAEAVIGTFSGAYVAPAPAYDGMRISVADSQGVTTVDSIGGMRFVHISSSTALWINAELYRRTVVRRDERITINAPVLAGAGVTVTVTFRARGVRMLSA